MCSQSRSVWWCGGTTYALAWMPAVFLFLVLNLLLPNVWSRADKRGTLCTSYLATPMHYVASTHASCPPSFKTCHTWLEKMTMKFLTFLPASLLWRFMRGWAFFGLFRLFRRSRASTKVLEKVIPKSTLSEQPDHCKKISYYCLIYSFFSSSYKARSVLSQALLTNCIVVLWNFSMEVTILSPLLE